MNFQCCRPAVTDPHKSDLVTTHIVAPLYKSPGVFRYLEYFRRNSCIYPQNGHLTRHCIYPQV